MPFRPLQDSSSHRASSLIERGAAADVLLEEYPHDDDELHGVRATHLADERRHRVVRFERETARWARRTWTATGRFRTEFRMAPGCQPFTNRQGRTGLTGTTAGWFPARS